jgi:hypothetical protein
MHVLDHGRVTLRFLFHRKCNLGFSPFNARRGTFFRLALQRFRLFCFVYDRQAVYAIQYIIDRYSEAGLRIRGICAKAPAASPYSPQSAALRRA